MDALNPLAGRVDHCGFPHPDARRQPPEPLTIGYPQAATRAGDWGTDSRIFTAIRGLNPARGRWRLRRSCGASMLGTGSSGKFAAQPNVMSYVGCTASRVVGRLSIAAVLGSSRGQTLPGLASPRSPRPGVSHVRDTSCRHCSHPVENRKGDSR